MTYINEIKHYIPPNKISNLEMESRITCKGKPIGKGIIGRLMGCKMRYFANANEQVSDLAVKAVHLLENDWKDADLLIFAAASSDLIEPATANIIQSKIGVKCPVFDVKNACNSFMSAIEIADSFVAGGVYKKILIVCGEKLSDVIRYHTNDEQHLLRCIAGYSLGDGGVAALVSAQPLGGRILHKKSMSWGEHWATCSVLGGGSMQFRNSDAYFFEADAHQLRQTFQEKLLPLIDVELKKCSFSVNSIDKLVTHQVSGCTSLNIAQALGVATEKCIQTFQEYGNIAAATVPAAISYGLSTKKIKSGDIILVVGMAAGISISIQIIQWR